MTVGRGVRGGRVSRGAQVTVGRGGRGGRGSGGSSMSMTEGKRAKGGKGKADTTSAEASSSVNWIPAGRGRPLSSPFKAPKFNSSQASSEVDKKHQQDKIH